MKVFYATFMQKQAFKQMYVEISAHDENMAREVMFAHFGNRFFSVYSEDQFSGQREAYGLRLLCHIQAIDHGSSVEYVFLGGAK